VQFKVDLYSIVLRLARLYGKIPRSFPFLGNYAFPPAFMVLELTYRCNLACSFCYLRHSNRTASEYNSTELTYAEILDIARKAPPWTGFLFSGGEVLLREDLPEILKAVIGRHPCHIFTNGTLITPAIAAQWIEWGIASVAISVEGTEDVHDRVRGRGSHTGAVAALRMLSDCKARKGSRYPLLNLKTTIMAENAGNLSESMRIAEDAGADYCTFQALNNTACMGALSLRENLECAGGPKLFFDFPTEDLERELKRIQELSPKLRVRARFLPDLATNQILAHYSNSLDFIKYDCVSPWMVMYISPAGYVYPCLNYHIGNMRNQSLRRLWNSPRYRHFRERISKKGLFSECRGCCDLIPK
jgi:MoaA/NifB/PqqE/SkfB family radical SAM enzyme